MKHFTPKPASRNARVFLASILSYLMLAGQVAPLALASSGSAMRAAPARPSGQSRGAGRAQGHNSSAEPAALAAAAPVITATKADTFTDSPADGKVEPGQEINYEVTVSNTGDADATGVVFNDDIDDNTTLTGVVSMSPLARVDSYAAPTGAPLTVNAAAGVLANDSGLPAPSAVAISNGPTAKGGTVTLNTDGSFTYTPPAGPFSGADSFTYTATNTNAPDDGATVNITFNPGAANDSATVNEDSSGNTINVLSNDPDPDGGTKLIDSVQQPANGTAAITNGGNDLTYTPNPNYCNDGASFDTFTYTLTPGGASATVSVTVTCVDDNPPAANDAATVGEDSGATSIDVLANDTDPDGGTKAIASASDPAHGTVVLTGGSPGAHTGLTYQPDPNYCNNPPGTTLDTFTYTLTPGGATATVSVTVTCANDAPTDIALSNSSVAENSAVGTAVGTFSTTDVDAGDTHTYSLVPGAGDTDNASFTIDGNTLKTAASFDFEAKSSYTVRVRSTDAASANFEKQFTINVTNVNEAPTDIALSNSSVAENSASGTAVGSLSTTDQDAGDTHTYSLVAGTGDADNASFQISGNQLQTAAPFDFEAKSSYTVRVRSTDSGGLTVEEAFTINVTNANDAPSDIALSNSSVAENSASGTVVGSLSTTDQDAGDTHTYTLVAGTGGDDNASFQIVGNQLQTAAVFNFESKSSYSIRVRSTDAASANFEKVFTITVTNVNEAPTDIALSNASVGENMPSGTAVGNLSTTDVDSGDTHSYSLVAGTGDTDNASFQISGNQLQTAASFDFETKSSYTVRVRSTDSGGQAVEEAFTITIVNNNEAPTDIALSSASVPENSPSGTAVGNLSTTDPDSGDTHTYSLVPGAGGDDNGSFQISGNQLQTAASFDFEAKSSYTVRVRSTDSGGLTVEEAFTINVTDVNEGPTLTAGGATATFTEDGAAVAVDPGLTIADVDSTNIQSATVQITGNFQTAEDVLAFVNTAAITGSYNAATGTLTLTGGAPVADYQAALRSVTYSNSSQNPNTGQRTVSFTATDSGGAPGNTVGTGVTVIAVNDAPVVTAGGTLAYTENAASTNIDTTITIADVDSANLQSATVQITGNYSSGQDVLSFIDTAAITSSYNTATGTLTLTGSAPVADYQAALRAVKYHNSSDDPSTATRTVTWVVNDGGPVNNTSAPVTSTVTVTAVNDKPTAFSYASLPAQASIPITYPAGKLGGTDLEAGTTITINTTPDTLCSGCLLTINTNGGFTFTPPPSAAGTTVGFTYHVSDNGNPAPGVNSDPVTVSFAVAGPELYFVKTAAVGAGNCTLGNECTLSTATTNIGTRTNTRIFIEDAGTHTSGVALTDGSWLIGQGVTGTTFDTLFGINPAPAQGTLATRPGVGLPRPTLNDATATVTAHNNSAVRGLNIDVDAGSGAGVVAVNRTGTLVFSDMNVTSAAGNAIDLSNTSASFLGPHVISTTSGTGFEATGGGTVTVAGTTNTINSTAGTGLNISNTTIGAANVTFRSITVGTGSGSVGAGIRLDTTGSSGGLRVTGLDGGDADSNPDAGSGGTIQHKTGADGNTSNGIGIYLNNTRDVQLAGMQLNDFDNFAVRGSSVTNFTMTDTVINGTNGTNDSFDEGSVRFTQLAGSASITRGTISGGYEDNLSVVNTSGTLDRLTVDDIDFGANSLNFGSDGILVEAAGTAVLKVTIQNSAFTSTRGDHVQYNVAGGTPTGDFQLLNNTFNNNHAGQVSGAGGIRLTSGGTAAGMNVTYNISGNNIQGARGTAIGVTKGAGNGIFTGTLNANVIGTAGTANSGSLEGTGINIVMAESGRLSANITNNQVRQYNNHGIFLQTGGTAVIGNGGLRAVVTGNTIKNPGTNTAAHPPAGVNGVHLNAGTLPGDTYQVCLTLGGAGALENDMVGAGDNVVATGTDFRLRQRQSTTVYLTGYGGANNDDAAVVAYVQSINAGTPTGNVSNTVPTGGGYTGAACPLPLPVFLASEGGVESAQCTARIPAAEGEQLGRAGLDSVVAAALRRWEATGLTAAQLEAMRGVRFDVADLPGSNLGEAEGRTVRLDRDAGGKGWFVDATPMDDAEFSADGGGARRHADAHGEPAGRVDLLTVVWHELGHAAGLADSYVPADSGSLMYGYLSVGERRLPVEGEAAAARPGTLAGSHFIALAAAQGKPRVIAAPKPKPVGEFSPSSAPVEVSVNIGTMPAGKSVKIRFKVQVNTPFNGSTLEVRNQGSVSYNESGGTPVLTDDPSEGGANDATVTPVQSSNIQVNDAKASEPASGTTPMLFTVTLSHPAGASGVSVNYSTASGGSNPATGGSSCGGAVDYETVTNGTLNFSPGEKVKNISVNVCADSSSPESDETFLLNLSGAVNGQLSDAQATGTITQGNPPGAFLISELRTSGPSGPGDDFVELYNNTDSELVVSDGTGVMDSTHGYGVFKMGADCSAAPILVGVIPNGTKIPARGHFLFGGSQYSLSDYGIEGGASGEAARDRALLFDLENDVNVAVFSTADPLLVSSAARLDSVGFGSNTGGVCELMREGATLPPVSGSATQHTFFRKECDFVGMACTTPGVPKDTGDNSADFMFADTAATPISGVPQKLGAPGPQRSTSPLRRDHLGLALTLLDVTKASAASPNRERSFTSDPGNNSQFGTLTVRRRITNTTGKTVTRLRARIVEMTTLFNPDGSKADLRARTSGGSANVGPINDPAVCGGPGTCTVNVQGTAVESPSAANNGGMNSTMTVTLPGAGLATGATVYVEFLLGIQKPGDFRFYVIVEALPE